MDVVMEPSDGPTPGADGLEFAGDEEEELPLLLDEHSATFLIDEQDDDGEEAPFDVAGEERSADAPAVPALARALKDSSSNVRRGAAIALGRIGPGAMSTVPALLELLQDRDPPTRLKVAGALAQISPEAVRQTVAHTAPKDYPRDIQELTIRAISTEWPTAVPGLLRCLEDRKDPRLRGTAAYVLGRMSTCAPSATPALLKQAVNGLIRTLAGDPDPKVRGDAAYALSELGRRQLEDEGVCKL